MDYKVTFNHYPHMTRYFNKECGWTIKELTEFALKKMYPGMTAKIELADELIKEIIKE